MRKFCISTLGCKVNHYESEQIATLLRSRGWTLTEHVAEASLRIVNTCSVTIQAASKSRQTVRQVVKLPVLQTGPSGALIESSAVPSTAQPAGELQSALALSDPSRPAAQRVLVTGCWATSDRQAASRIPGVTAVLTHHDDLAAELDRLLALWDAQDMPSEAVAPLPDASPSAEQTPAGHAQFDAMGSEPMNPIPTPGPSADEGWMMRAGTPADHRDATSKPTRQELVKKKSRNQHTLLSFAQLHAPEPNRTGDTHPAPDRPLPVIDAHNNAGTANLPLLDHHQDSHQRGFLKVQDGCDAHCTYCIIPNLRPRLWSKPIDDVVEEARRLVSTGHVELVLTGIFLGAYGQPTALRRRQPDQPLPPIGAVVDALCTRVPELRRLRLSSLEPGDLTPELLAILRSHRQVVPHFHLPLQSGSDHLLRRMNRQYTRDDFLRMLDQVHAAFDRPALTTDIIVGFPGETDEEFIHTLDVVDRARFIHVHAFPFSPRPGTAAARWQKDFVHGPVVNDRINRLRDRATRYSLSFRQQFVGETVELLVERMNHEDRTDPGLAHLRHGRCERYFPVHFESPEDLTGACVHVRIDRVSAQRTHGTLVEVEGATTVGGLNSFASNP